LILGFSLGEWIYQYLYLVGTAYFPANFTPPSILIPGAIVLDTILLITNSYLITGFFGALAWGLIFYPGNWAMLAPYHLPVEYHGMLMSLADIQGYQYVRIRTPEYMRMIEGGTSYMSTLYMGDVKYTVLVSAFFAGLISIITYFTFLLVGRWFYTVSLFKSIKDIKLEKWGRIRVELLNKLNAFQEQLSTVQSNIGAKFPTIEKEVKRISNSQQIVQEELHNYLIVRSLGLDPDNVRLHRFLPVRIYLPKEDQLQVQSIISFLDAFGFVVSDDFPPEEGSWVKNFFAKTKDVLTQPEFIDRLNKVERAIELRELQKQQAEIDNIQAGAVTKLLNSLGNTPNAAFHIGSVLLLKCNGIPIVRTLTQKEMIHLEQNPHLLRKPEEILESLSNSLKSKEYLTSEATEFPINNVHRV
jgi:hypothetical protein